jgi:hypothetical protein
MEQPMKEPKLTLGLASRGDQPVILISRNDSQMLNRIDHPLARLANEGYMGACYDTGVSVLRMLAIAHPHAFAPYPALSPPAGPIVSAYDLISYLHHQSRLDRTCRYVDTIDALIERHKVELAKPACPNSGPSSAPTFCAHIPNDIFAASSAGSLLSPRLRG